MDFLKNLHQDKYQDLGFLVIRLGIGLMFMYHGYPKIMGGMERWVWLGGAMSNLGISFFPAFWGFMAAFSEFFGGLLLVLGFAFRVSTILLGFTMFVAILFHISAGDSLSAMAHAVESMAVFIGLMLAGTGKYALDRKYCKLSKR